MGGSYSMPTRPIAHCMTKLGDNETVDMCVLDRPTTVKSAVFATEAAFDGGTGIDLIDGGSDGTGTDLIAASSDALNGEEEVSPTGNQEMADGHRIRVTFDNTTTPRDTQIVAICHVYR